MKTILISVCSNRKKKYDSSVLRAADLPVGTQNNLSSIWLSRLSQAQPVAPLKFIYASRSAKIMRETALYSGSPLYYISAGLGLVNADLKVPIYDLTITKKGINSIMEKVSDEKFDPFQWWKSLNGDDHHPVVTLIRKNSDTLFVLSLSYTYYSMIKNDLMNLSQDELKRVRITGINLAKNDKLFSCLLPYDLRFNGPDSPIPGTLSDYSQRCASHYIRHVLPKTASKKDIIYIASYMSTLRPPQKISRTTKTDNEMVSLMKKVLLKKNMSSSAMLRYIRHTKNYACEQKRCANLYKQALRSVTYEK